MDCLEFRRLTLINPDDYPARVAHEDRCTRCAAFARQLRKQDALVREATHVEVPDGLAARILLNQSLATESRWPRRRTWLGLAASLIVAAIFLPSLLQDVFYHPLENELISHVTAHDVRSHGDHLTDPDDIRKVLAMSGTAMPENISNIIYAATCIVDGQEMAHLLVQYGNAEYVVFLVPQQSFDDHVFARDGWTGQLAQVDHRSIAVLNSHGTEPGAATDDIAVQFSRSLPRREAI